MSIDKIRITNLLEIRYDYMSARNVLNNWRKQNGIKDELESFTDADIRSLVIYLQNNAPEASRTIGGLERLILTAEATPAEEKIEEVVAPAVEEVAAPAIEEVVAPAVEEVVAPMADNNPVVEAETEINADSIVEEAPAAENTEEAPAAESTEEAPVAEEGKKKKKGKK